MHAAQDPVKNLVHAGWIVPGDAAGSPLMALLQKDDAARKVRRMPLYTDALSAREMETLRRWIAGGAR